MKPLKAQQGPWDILSQTAGNLWKHKVLQVKPSKNLIFLAAARHFGLKTIGLLQKCPPKAPNIGPHWPFGSSFRRNYILFYMRISGERCLPIKWAIFETTFFICGQRSAGFYWKSTVFYGFRYIFAARTSKIHGFGKLGGVARSPPQGGDEEGLGVRAYHGATRFLLDSWFS